MVYYYIDILPDCTDKNHPWKKDDNGVVMAKIPYTNEYHYHATNIASYVIKYGCKKNLNWLLNNQDIYGSYHHDFILPFYKMEKGWVGGLAQSLAASALKYNNYLDEGKQSIDALLKKCYNNGVIYEYPEIEILNGWIYGIFGLMDFVDEYPEYQKKLDESLICLKNKLKKYNINGWTAYDYTGIPATPFYHNLHLKQFKILNINWKEKGKYPKISRFLYLFRKHKFKLPLLYYRRKKWLKY